MTRNTKIIVKSFLLLVLLQIGRTGLSQSHTAVNITTSLFPPCPVYLNDYLQPGSNKLNIGLLFTDSNEPSWDVYIKIKIESSNVIIESKSGFKPSVPITLNYGVLRTLTNTDLYEYFDYNNLNFQGMSSKTMEQSGGKLPEGFYTLCVEAFDYASGLSLSTRQCTPFRIELIQSPQIIVPQQNYIVTQTDVQNIVFQWQQPMADPNTTRYNFHLYEATDPTTDPKLALANNTALKLHTAENIAVTTFLYDVSKPILEKGKKYIYQIEAVNINDRTIFKNDGLSEAGVFYYGYPTGGTILLEAPAKEYGYTLREDKILKWLAPDNIVNGQQYKYKIKIIEVQEGQLADDAMAINPVFYEYEDISLTGSTGRDHIILKKLEALKKYAWQVKAFSEDQEIAQSEISTFYGPPLMEMFKAGNHNVQVLTTSSVSFEDLSGTGKVKISSAETVEVQFEHIRLKKLGAEWFLLEGEVHADMSSHDPFALTPEYAQNGPAVFQPEKLRLSANGMELYGIVKWTIPMLIDSEMPMVLETQPAWINYDTYELIGSAPVAENSTEIKLLDPLNFSISLDKTSNILIRNSQHYKLRFSGKVNLPSSIVTVNNDPVSLRFEDEQLFYLTGRNPGIQLRLINKTDILFSPNSYIIDFSNEKSPEKHKTDPQWKGVVFDNFDLSILRRIDYEKQLRLFAKEEIKIENSDLDSAYAWVLPTGLDFYVDYSFQQNAENAWFNTFPSRLKSLQFKIAENKVVQGMTKGSMRVPILSETEYYNFSVPINNLGFAEGNLDESLQGKSYVFNSEGGEQKINMTVKRAVFEENECIDMTLDIEWPAINITLESVTGFKAWGNYSIGFLAPNGSIYLPDLVAGDVRGYPLTVNTVGAGSDSGVYALGISGEVVMSEDIAGANGPPITNLYSIAKNSALGVFVPVETAIEAENIQTGTTAKSSTETPVDNTTQQNPSDVIQEDNMAETAVISQDQVNDAKNEVLALLGEENQGIDSSILDPQPVEPVSNTSVSNTDSTSFGFTVSADFSEENLQKLIDNITAALPEDLQEDVRKIQEVILSFEERYQVNLYEELKDVDALLKKILKNEYDRYIESLLKPIEDVANEANKFISGNVKIVVDSINSGVNIVVSSSIDVIADGVKELTQDNTVKQDIDDYAETFSTIISKEITDRITRYTTEYIVKPITEGLIGTFTGIIHDSIESQLQTAGHRIIDNQFEANLEGVIDINRILESLNTNLFSSLFNIDSLNSRVYAAKDAFFNEYFNPTDIFDHLCTKLASTIYDSITDNVTDAIVDGITDLLGEEAGDVAEIGLDYLQNAIQIDFENIGEKIRTGDIGSIIKFDPSVICINTDLVEATGTIKMETVDVYGDVFRGQIDVLVKVPKKFRIKAKFLSGQVAESEIATLYYWYVGAGIQSDEGAIPLGPVNLVRLSGYLYHHMNAESEDPLPDGSIAYGGNLGMTIFDFSSNGKLFALELDADVVTKTDGNFKMAMKGRIKLGSSPAQPPLGTGTIDISYDSETDHFLGKGWVKISQAVCIEGTILVDIEPDKWRVALGSEENKVLVLPGCFGWGGKGWLDVDQEKIGLGIGIGFAGEVATGEVSFLGTCYSAYAGFGFFAGVSTTIQYAPSLKLNSVGVWGEAYADLGVKHHKCSSSSYGKWVIASANLSGKANMVFNPPPTKATGSFNASITLFGFLEVGGRFDFDVTLT